MFLSPCPWKAQDKHTRDQKEIFSDIAVGAFHCDKEGKLERTPPPKGPTFSK